MIESLKRSYGKIKYEQVLDSMQDGLVNIYDRSVNRYDMKQCERGWKEFVPSMTAECWW